ncbi:MAG: histidine ammonia-lyase [Bacteroidales bacterium]|nr:histidine ammonia-lyase [Bacteroidales bacterium]
MKTFHYGEDSLTAGIALDLCKGTVKGMVSEAAGKRIRMSHEHVMSVIRSHKTVYGINTGFGPLCTTKISDEDIQKLQLNLLRSHSVGVGQLIPPEISKLMLILKVHALARGYSGISPETILRIIWHIDEDIIPCVPSQGSVGASGDLAPLAHLFLPLIGSGEIWYRGRAYPAGEILRKHGVEALVLGPKEGLALINGTQFISAFGIKVLERFQHCLDLADITASFNLEALMGSVKTFDEELHQLRPYAGSAYVARRMRTLLDKSEIVESHKNCTRVQDPYSLRCIPQVHGASRDAWLHLKEMLHTEINSVTDNPILFSEDKIITGGNFHGQPIALPLDYATLAAAEMGNIADRRIYLSLMEKVEGLPKLLMRDTGLNSGFMILQYTTAALASENKCLCFPASADSIPTSLGQEDHVSMGSISARKALQVVDNLEKILGIELFSASQGFEFRKPLKSGLLLEACFKHIRTKIAFADSDHILTEEIDRAINMVRNKELTSLTADLAKEKKIIFKNETDELFGIY